MGKKSKKGRDKWEDLWPDDHEATAAKKDTCAISNEEVWAQSTADGSSPPEAGTTESEAEREEELKPTSMPNTSATGVACKPVTQDEEASIEQRVCNGKECREADKGSRRRSGDKKPVEKHLNDLCAPLLRLLFVTSQQPGKLGFDGIEDGGASQSLYKNMSSGARQ
eukprot:gene31060-38959_t